MSAMQSEYELLRLKNIERNQQFLREIGLALSIPSLEPAQKSMKRKVEKIVDEGSTARRSSRLALLQVTSVKESQVSLSISTNEALLRSSNLSRMNPLWEMLKSQRVFFV
jgi:hypothetical protein